MRVRDQLVYLGRLCGRTSAAVNRTVDTWLDRLGLSTRAGYRLDALSHGNQQRVQLIAAMNPCKCGGAAPGQACKRGPRCAEEYQSRVSGPLLLGKRKARYATCAIAAVAADFDLFAFGQPESPSAAMASSTLATSLAGP